MKKLFSMILALTMTLTLAACGSKETSTGGADEGAVDLNAFYAELSETYGMVDGEKTDPEEFQEDSIMMMDLTAEPEFMENYYPGLKDIATKQLIAQTSMISATANEFVFVECENEDDAAKVAEILQGRVTMQAEGGAWYPETVEAWTKAQVVTHGNFVGMIVSQGNQDEATEAFNALFA